MIEMRETSPPAEVLTGGTRAESSRAGTNPPASSATSPSSSSSLFEENEPAPRGKAVLSADSAEASGRQGISPSDAGDAQVQLSQPGSGRATAGAHTINSPVEPTTVLRRRHTQQAPSSQQPQGQAGGGTNVSPTVASRAWTFFVQKLVPIAGFLGLVLAFAFGIGAWMGMNYANSYSKKQYDIALFGACHDYEDIRNTAFCDKVINAGIATSGLVKRQPEISIDEPAYASGFMYSPLTPAKLVLWALSETRSNALAVASRLGRTAHFVLWTFPMSIQDGGDISRDSHGLDYGILEMPRMGLFIGWQILLFGCSRFCLLLSIILVGEFLPQSIPRGGNILAAFTWGLISFDLVHVLVAQAWAHWVPALLLLLAFCFLFVVGWDEEENGRLADNLSSMALPLLTMGSTVMLLVGFLPCSLMHPARIVVLLFSLVGLLATWGTMQGVWRAAAVLGLLTALLDLFHPNMITALFYAAHCE